MGRGVHGGVGPECQWSGFICVRVFWRERPVRQRFFFSLSFLTTCGSALGLVEPPTTSPGFSFIFVGIVYLFIYLFIKLISYLSSFYYGHWYWYAGQYFAGHATIFSLIFYTDKELVNFLVIYVCFQNAYPFLKID